MKMEPIVSSETSAIRTQTPGNYPKRNNLHLEHGESLRTTKNVTTHFLHESEQFCHWGSVPRMARHFSLPGQNSHLFFRSPRD